MPQVQQSHMISIGNKSVLVEDEEFARAYDVGYETYHRYHRDEDVIDSAILLFQLRNGWNGDRSDMWTTGYLLGWLAAFYEREEGQLARTVDIRETVACTHERHTQTRKATSYDQSRATSNSRRRVSLGTDIS